MRDRQVKNLETKIKREIYRNLRKGAKQIEKNEKCGWEKAISVN